ncbi:snRNA-activating protein complex subunit 1a isoform X1 [Coregonus clupeaformis]|uniref:snRNA-activating protein complex subunit 1a isoform X1 n=1 Tax=Coregonus clupeaformis TaxID=59861 RepID=UPI001BE08A2F|nr:snRNA-activating protein complex subunit 1a isoform X1 [Coregonus clupeaformis]
MPNGKAKDYFLKPLVADYEELLGRFQQTESVRFEEFTAIWRSMGFSSLFYGSLAGNKMREFCHLTLTMAFNYFLPPYSFQIRVGGLYLLYGLYHTQLASPKEKIRIALKDWEQIQKFYQDSVNSQHYDAVYIIRKLIAENAVLYTAMPQMLTFRVKKKPQHHKVCEEFRDRPERVKDLISTDMLQEVANIQGHYERLKASVLERSSIAVTQQDLPARLHSCVLEFLHWQDRHEDRGDADLLVAAEEKAQQVESSNRAQLLASIKTKSYGHLAEASKSRRHRQVEMDASISGTDHFQEAPKYHKSRAPSLRARTCKNLCGEGDEQKTQYWLLSVAEEDKTALKRPKRKQKFRW